MIALFFSEMSLLGHTSSSLFLAGGIRVQTEFIEDPKSTEALVVSTPERGAYLSPGSFPLGVPQLTAHRQKPLIFFRGPLLTEDHAFPKDVAPPLSDLQIVAQLNDARKLQRHP